MSKEHIVSAGRHETRVAILEDDQVVELFHEREKEYSLAGSIHKGRVTRVLPGMQSAFVDIGLDRDAFLYVSDFFEDNDEYEAVVSTVEEKVLKLEKGGGTIRGQLPEPEPSAPAIQSEEVASGAAAGAAASVTVAGPNSAGTEHRPEAGRDGRGDRGGRGRRGRRRRGGRGNGLPDSKFFSPKAETAGAPVAEDEAEAEAGDEAPADTHVSFESASHESVSYTSRADDDFMVLPGESLAKYSPGDGEAEARGSETAAVAVTTTPEPVEEPQVATALPGEHPLAGFGEVAGWVTSSVAEEPPAAGGVLNTVPDDDDEGLERGRSRGSRTRRRSARGGSI